MDVPRHLCMREIFGMHTPHLIGFRSQRVFRRISGNVRKLAL